MKTQGNKKDYAKLVCWTFFLEIIPQNFYLTSYHLQTRFTNHITFSYFKAEDTFAPKTFHGYNLEHINKTI